MLLHCFGIPETLCNSLPIVAALTPQVFSFRSFSNNYNSQFRAFFNYFWDCSYQMLYSLFCAQATDISNYKFIIVYSIFIPNILPILLLNFRIFFYFYSILYNFDIFSLDSAPFEIDSN